MKVKDVMTPDASACWDHRETAADGYRSRQLNIQ